MYIVSEYECPSCFSSSASSLHVSFYFYRTKTLSMLLLSASSSSSISCTTAPLVVFFSLLFWTCSLLSLHLNFHTTTTTNEIVAFSYSSVSFRMASRLALLPPFAQTHFVCSFLLSYLYYLYKENNKVKWPKKAERMQNYWFIPCQSISNRASLNLMIAGQEAVHLVV